MGVGNIRLDSSLGFYVQMNTQSMLALIGFLRDLRFPPAFKIVVVRDQNPLAVKMWTSKCR